MGLERLYRFLTMHLGSQTEIWKCKSLERVDRQGVEPCFPACKAGVVPFDQQPKVSC